MVRTIVESSFDIDHGITSNNSIFQCFTYAVLDRFNVFPRYRTANNGIDKLKTFATLVWCYSYPHITILTMPTSLPDMLTLSSALTCNRLAVGNLRTSYVCPNFKFTEKTIHNHFKMQLTHSTNNGLARFGICMQLESRIFFRQFIQSNRHFILISTSSWFDGNRNHWLWESDGL